MKVSVYHDPKPEDGSPWRVTGGTIQFDVDWTDDQFERATKTGGFQFFVGAAENVILLPE